MVQREGVRNWGKFKGRRCHPVRVTAEHQENLVMRDAHVCVCARTCACMHGVRVRERGREREGETHREREEGRGGESLGSER